MKHIKIHKAFNFINKIFNNLPFGMANSNLTPPNFVLKNVKHYAFMMNDGKNGVERGCLFLLGGDRKFSCFVCSLSHGRKGKLCVLGCQVVKLYCCYRK
jgi:hypothetical protein